jgi:hypothetical protein
MSAMPDVVITGRGASPSPVLVVADELGVLVVHPRGGVLDGPEWGGKHLLLLRGTFLLPLLLLHDDSSRGQ